MSATFEADAYMSGCTDLEAIHAACAAATAAGPANVVRLSCRTWDVEHGLSLAGYTCSLVGVGSSATGATLTGTVLHATTQAGAVLDLTGWKSPGNFVGRMEVGGFSLRGSNVADATKANAGIRRADYAMAAVYVHDISIAETGGPGIDITAAYLSDFARIAVLTPVAAKANDVPYMIWRGCNGNRMDGLGLRSMGPSADVGVGGALVVTDDGSSGSVGNVWASTWFEYLHIPSDGTFIHNAASGQTWSGTYFVDCGRESGAVGTSYVRLAPSAYNNGGRNSWTGLVPGNYAADTGIIISQSGNVIDGVKGSNAANVTLAAGVKNTTVILSGGTYATAGVVDNSGETSNVLIDHRGIDYKHGTWRVSSGSIGPTVSRATDATSGAVYLGNAGVRLYSSSGNLYTDAGTHHFRTKAGATAFQMNAETAPGLRWPDIGTLPTPTNAERGKVAFVKGGTGTADQMYLCRRTSAGYYEWTPLAY